MKYTPANAKQQINLIKEWIYGFKTQIDLSLRLQAAFA